MSRKTKHHVGAVMGDLTIVENLGLSNGNLLWRCICKCGRETKKHSTTISTSNNKCYHDRHHRSKGVGEVPGAYWSALLRSAHQRDIEVTVDQQEIWDLFLQQDRKCALSNLPLSFKSDKPNRCNGTASLDRIDSTQGYVLGNIWWVHKDINKMKMDFSIQRFREMCKLVTESGIVVG